MDAICYGFRSFGQLLEDPFLSILSQLEGLYDHQDTTVECITFSWSRCYIFLSDNSLIVRGFIGSQSKFTKKNCLPFNDTIRKVLFLKDYDLFLTEKGNCWRYFRNGNDGGEFCFEELCHVGKIKSKERHIIDLASNGDGGPFTLLDSGVLLDPRDSMILPGIKIKKISCGFEHNLALSQSGSVYVWGVGSRGQLGNGSLLTAENPELLEILDGLFISDIAAGGWHSVASTTCGALYSWGWNNFGQLGFRSDRNPKIENVDTFVSVLPEPELVEWPNNAEVLVKQVACGNTHTMVLSDDGLVWGCGNNKYKQLNPHLETEYLDEMTRVPIPSNVNSVIKISCASWNSTLYITRGIQELPEVKSRIEILSEEVT